MKYKEAFTQTGGVFGLLQTFDVPWKEENIAANLGIMYMTRSGNKTLSTLYDICVPDTEHIGTGMIEIARSLYTLYITKWNKLYNTLSLEYNPLENYNGTETETIGEFIVAINTTDSSDTSNSTESEQTYGFNSSEATDKDRTEANTSASSTSSNSGNSDRNQTRTLTKSGNIGVTTSQEMLQSERDLWYWLYFEEVFKDIDNALTLPIY